ncbi:hypothetical protein F-M6_0079 [Faustovirus]|nr:hypothetical protein F-M6_0079 [Faustovirus]
MQACDRNINVCVIEGCGAHYNPATTTYPKFRSDLNICDDCKYMLCEEFECMSYPNIKLADKSLEFGRVDGYKLTSVHQYSYWNYHGDLFTEYIVKLTKLPPRAPKK